MLVAQPWLARVVGPELSPALSFALALGWLLARRPASARRVSRADLGRGLAAGFVGLPALCFLCGLIALGAGIEAGLPLPPGAASPVLLLALLVLGPAFEELLYRERLLGALAARGPRGVALLASSVAFAIPHAEPRLVLATFLVGLVLGELWLRSRSLGLCIGLHAGLNLAVHVSGVPPGSRALSPLWSAVAAGLLLRRALAKCRA